MKKLSLIGGFTKHAIVNVAKNPIDATREALDDRLMADDDAILCSRALGGTLLGLGAIATGISLMAGKTIGVPLGVSMIVGGIPAGIFLPEAVYVGVKAAYYAIKNLPGAFIKAAEQAAFDQSPQGIEQKHQLKIEKIRKEQDDMRAIIAEKDKFLLEYAQEKIKLAALKDELKTRTQGKSIRLERCNLLGR